LRALLIAALAVSTVGDFDTHGDVGSPKIPGTAAYNPMVR